MYVSVFLSWLMQLFFGMQAGAGKPPVCSSSSSSCSVSLVSQYCSSFAAFVSSSYFSKWLSLSQKLLFLSSSFFFFSFQSPRTEKSNIGVWGQGETTMMAVVVAAVPWPSREAAVESYILKRTFNGCWWSGARLSGDHRRKAVQDFWQWHTGQEVNSQNIPWNSRSVIRLFDWCWHISNRPPGRKELLILSVIIDLVFFFFWIVYLCCVKICFKRKKIQHSPSCMFFFFLSWEL